MPETENNGFFLDETIEFTEEQLDYLKNLVDLEKNEEAKEYIRNVRASRTQTVAPPVDVKIETPKAEGS